MDFRLVDDGWLRLFDEAAQVDRKQLRIVCPFIKEAAAARLLKKCGPQQIQVITRFNLRDFCDGVSDTAALRLLLAAGAQIRGVKGLHAKLYLFGRTRAIVTSANLTDAALQRNHEFGFVADETSIIDHCQAYFDDLWKRAGANLTIERIDSWNARLKGVTESGGRPSEIQSLPDEGTVIAITHPPLTPPLFTDATQFFVKFFGTADDRRDRNVPVLAEVDRSESHLACTYPRGKRPRRPKDGAIMFIGVLSKPGDILVYGRAIGKTHTPGEDDASPEDIRRRPWKKNWPHYIRVHQAEFIAGLLDNCVPLSALMDALGPKCFASTLRNLGTNRNTTPRAAFRRRGDVELSPYGAAWLNDHLDRAMAVHGRITPAELEQLYWPDSPVIQ